MIYTIIDIRSYPIHIKCDNILHEWTLFLEIVLSKNHPGESSPGEFIQANCRFLDPGESSLNRWTASKQKKFTEKTFSSTQWEIQIDL